MKNCTLCKIQVREYAARGLCWACYSKGRRQGKWAIRYDNKPVTLERLDLAWMAGFFDGEGSISLSVHTQPKNRIQVQIQITNSIKATLEPFSKYFSGNINKHYRKNPKELPQYKWSLQSAKKSYEFLNRFMPYFRAKADVAELAIKALEIQLNHKPRKGFGYTDDQIEFFKETKQNIIRLNKCS
ncbi:MAG TPA: hypothetical protein ENI07_10280 [Desulfobacterales bacterium]|nr:hypothetical protein [Desulfobacterales bacterium]